MDISRTVSGLYDQGIYWLVSNPSATFLVALFLAVLLGVLGVSMMFGNRGSAPRRLAGDTVSVGGLANTPRLRYETRDTFWTDLVSAIEKRVPLIDEANRSLMQRRLMQAGFMGAHVVRNYYAVRFFLTVCLPVAFLLLAPLFGASLANQKVIFVALGFCIAGLYLPIIWLSRRISNRQRAIAEGFPDALDMMVVCVEAGLSLDAAFNRVGAELTRSHPALATQFALVSLELRAGKSRSDALRNLADRIGLDEVGSFVTLMIQSDTLGTSIAQTLVVHADEMRTRRTLHAEEKANKLPVKLTVPLVVFILPCLMTVVMLPAIINIIRKLLPALAGG
jgi:tight adherence protein C